jgi:hypothetical protein
MELFRVFFFRSFLFFPLFSFIFYFCSDVCSFQLLVWYGNMCVVRMNIFLISTSVSFNFVFDLPSGGRFSSNEKKALKCIIIDLNGQRTMINGIAIGAVCDSFGEGFWTGFIMSLSSLP